MWQWLEPPSSRVNRWQIQQPDWMQVYVACIDAKYDRELVSAEQALELFCVIEELDSWHSGIVAAV